MATRPTKNEYFLRMAELVATRATCLRRSVGCVLVNARGHVLATGYNGNASGLPHCDEEQGGIFPNACEGACAPSGTNLDGCEAIHAEQNALLQCRDVYQIAAGYVTHSPCVTCTKLLLGTSCHTILFRNAYAQSGAELWRKSGRNWIYEPNPEGIRIVRQIGDLI